ncbi:MAG: serpin family protein [Actinobacteria bacterium]|uniref:Unannotated protein n=1 Tax=freshwater metagenome TaxID=449393 RepID=A0A6J6RTN5_9ZZZZ|nr:serpin family protein [Actinomycetota bacterium]
MLSRRHLFSLSALAIAAPALAACAGSSSPLGSTGPDAPGALRLVFSDVRRATPAANAIDGGVATVTAVGAALWSQLPTSGNVAISPFSVAVALGMTANGAGGTTLSEMLDVLDSADVAGLDTGLNALTQQIESLAGPLDRFEGDDAEIALDSANQLFGQDGVTWQPAFLDALARDFGAGMRTVDYVGEVETARSAINGWTAEQTHDRIPEIIPAGLLDSDSRLVLVNALYFKARWATTFEKLSTEDGDFTLADGTTVRVPMMHATVGQSSVGEGWTSVRLPYVGDTLAMTVVLADEGRESTLDARISAGHVQELLQTGARPVDLTMPRWTFRSDFSLKRALSVAGMTTAFSDEADFSRMTSDEALAVDDVLHQVFVAVDEDGTEAAAATAVGMTTTGALLTAESLVLDRAFLFVIYDVEHATPLFVGRVGDPRS